jgi:ribosome biogenesis GTPase
MNKARIVKGVGGNYIILADGELVKGRLRGKLRKSKVRPAVGDFVDLSIDPEGNTMIEKILPRRNALLRPVIANVDCAIIVFALKSPDPHLNLLDRFLVMSAVRGIDAIICLNKGDLVSDAATEEMAELYRNAGYQVLVTSAKSETGIDELREVLRDRISVFAGPSGVGKSSLLNAVQEGLALRTGEVSEKTQRGKHTTRHTELLLLKTGGAVADTPGFSALDLASLDSHDIQLGYPEMTELAGTCRFNDCLHRTEPGCAVRGGIDPIRYENYLLLLDETMNKRRY